ncbi:MAG TPA: hypothetical protein VI978_00460 [Candidatus Paceibacterota bacterium]
MRALRIWLGFLLGFLIGVVFFTSIGLAQDELSRVINSNVRLIERNHVRGDVANARAGIHNFMYHNQYGYGYENDGYFYGTDQYGRGNRGRTRISPIEVGIGGAIIGGTVGGWKGAAIGGVSGYFGTKAVKVIVNHKRNKKAEKEAEAMATQAEAEAQAMLEKKFFWNDFESVSVGVFYQDNSGSQYKKVGPGQRVELFVLPGTEIGVMAENMTTREGRNINLELRYGNGKQKLPANSGWRVFNPETGGY